MAAFLDDVEARGLKDKILLICSGEWVAVEIPTFPAKERWSIGIALLTLNRLDQWRFQLRPVFGVFGVRQPDTANYTILNKAGVEHAALAAVLGQRIFVDSTVGCVTCADVFRGDADAVMLEMNPVFTCPKFSLRVFPVAPHKELSLFLNPSDIGSGRPFDDRIVFVLRLRAVEAFGIRHAGRDVLMRRVVQIISAKRICNATFSLDDRWVDQVVIRRIRKILRVKSDSLERELG